MKEAPKVYKTKHKIGYGLGDMYAGGAFLLVGLLYLNFLTDVVGFTGTVAGIIFTVGKIWDAISDPLMGYFSDRTKSRFGRRRIYFVIGLIPIFLSFLLLWLNVGPDSVWSILYYILAYVFFNTTFTMVMVPYNSLLPNMVNDYQDRTKFNTVRMLFSSFSALLSAAVPMLIVNGAADQNTGYLIMGIVFGLIYALPWIGVFFLTWENPIEQRPEKQSVKQIFNNLLSTFKNKSFRTHMSFFVTAQTAVDFLTTLFIYLLKYVIFRDAEFSIIMGVLLVTQLACMPIHGYISNKYGKNKPMIIGMTAWAIGLILVIFIGENSPSYMIYLVAFLSGVGGSSAVFVPWSALPEISDVDELITGKRREGTYAGMSTLTRKIAQAITVFVIGVSLDIIKFDATLFDLGLRQSPETITGIKTMFIVFPLIFILLALYNVTRYRLTKNKHKVLMDEIASRKETHQASNNKEVIEVCKELTGLDYNQLSLFEE